MIIKKEDLRLKSVCSDKGRPVLNYIHITPKFSEASNGKILLRYTPKGRDKDADYPQSEAMKDENINPENIFISSKTAGKILKNFPEEQYDNLVGIQCTKEKVVITDIDSTSQFKLNDGENFPNTEIIVEKAIKESYAEVTVNVDMLLQLLNVVAKEYPDNDIKVCIPATKGEPMAIKASRKHGEYFGMIMPLFEKDE